MWRPTRAPLGSADGRGASAGAAIGSVVPVVGTAVGGLIGGIVGVLLGGAMDRKIESIPLRKARAPFEPALERYYEAEAHTATQLDAKWERVLAAAQVTYHERLAAADAVCSVSQR